MIATRTHGALSSFVTSCILFATIFIGISSPLAYSQSCNIHVAPEPTVVSKERAHRAVSQGSLPNNEAWTNLNAGVVSDDEYVNIELEPGAFSQTLTFDQFNLNIPTNSIIEGVKVSIEGNHEGAIPGMIDLSLTAANVNLASMVFSGTAWPSSDGNWGYGSNWFSWSTQFTAAQINNSGFGVNLRIQNNSTETLTANIDKLSVLVYYRAPYSVCLEHACIPFFTPEIAGALEYQWTIPAGFEVISSSALESTVLIAANGAGVGDYQVCLSPQMASGNGGSCCRYFSVADCSTSSIGNFVWNDINGNGLQDLGELGEAGIEIQLYDTYGVLVASTTTDANGAYQFIDILSGEYYIKAILIDDEELSPSHAGNGTNDSDITGVLGHGTSDFFFVPPGTNYDQVDVGLIISSKIEGQIWLDANADGIRQHTEDLLSGVTIELLDANNNVLFTQETGTDGSYLFMDLQELVYQIQITLADGYVITLQDIGVDDTDSDFDAQGNYMTNVLMDDIIIDGGLYKKAKIGNYLWVDLDRNGLQDATDQALSGVVLTLTDSNNQDLQTTTASNGAYTFDNLTPGAYALSWSIDNSLLLTIANQGTGSNDSRTAQVSGLDLSFSFDLVSDDQIDNYDFGFQNKPSSLTGTAWDDLDNDGLIDTNENGKAGVSVGLYTQAGVLVDTQVTDASGAYVFDNLNPASYYLVFSKPVDFEFSNGPSEQITESVVTGSTDIFNLGADQNLEHNAGYFSAITLGDFIWLDLNRDGIQNVGEPGIPDVMVILLNNAGSPIKMAMTDNNGAYLFEDVVAGSYSIGFMITANLIPTTFNQGSGSNDSRAFTQNGGAYVSQTFTVVPGTTDLDYDFGFVTIPSSISGYTFNDMNADGAIDIGDTPKANVAVMLYNDSNVLIASTTTDTDGLYDFPNLNPADYYVVFENITSESYSMGVDSHVSSSVSIGSTDLVTLGIDQNISLGAGYYSGITLGNYVWFDQNRDGIQDANEMGVPGLVMFLKNTNGVTVDMQTTDANGAYIFDIILPGAYTVAYTVPADVTSSPADQGNGTNDSRVVTNVGPSFTSEVFNLISGDSNLNIDFGLVSQPASISGYTFHDRDADGANDIEDEAKPNVKVELYTSTGVLVATTTTDINGTYTFDNLNPGDYYILFENIANEMYSMGVDSDVTSSIAIGATDVVSLAVNQNLDLDAGYFCFGSIGDMAWIDENMDGLYQTTEMPFAGLEIKLTNDMGVVLATQITGADGKYLFTNLLPDYYFVSFDLPFNYIPTTANVGTDITIDSDVTGFVATNTTSFFQLWSKEDNLDMDGGFTEVSASITGLTWIDVDKSGVRTADDILLPGILVELFDQSGVLVGSMMSSASGAYSFNNLIAGDYYVKFNFPAQYSFTDANVGANENRDSDVTDANGAMTTDIITLTNITLVDHVDAGVFEFSSLGDMVWLDEDENGNFESTEAGISGVTINLLDNLGAVFMTTVTDTDGKYNFANVPPGSYKMQFDTIQNYSFTTPNIGTDDIDSDAIVDVTTGLGISLPINVVSGSSNNSIDAGYQFNSGAGLEGIVWEDLNADGIRTANEPLIPNATINVLSTTGAVLATTTSDASGLYQVANISIEDFYVEFVVTGFDKITLADIGADDTIDSDITDANGTGTTDIFSPMILEQFTDVDGGFYQTSMIGNFVWDDLNMDGIQDANELGREAVAIDLRTSAGTLVGSTVSGSDGSYSFSGIDPGNYIISFTSLYPYIFTLADVGSDDTKDSDAISNGTTVASTAAFDIVSGMNNLDIDAGVFEEPLVTIVGAVFEDMNGDGLKDLGDIFLNGIDVTLFNAAGVAIQQTTTIDDPSNGLPGFYTFVDLPPDAYYVSFDFPSGTVSTFPNVGNETLDSDVTDANGFGSTDILDYGQAGTPTFICGGFYNTVSIGNYLWEDFLVNGIQDPTEIGVNSVAVRLYNAAGVQQMMEFTQNDANGDPGYYLFDNLAPGAYYIQVDNGLTMSFTNPFEGNDTDVDSNIDHSNGPSTSTTVVLESGDSDLSIDAGLLMEPGDIGNYVWIDTDGNGCQDSNELGLNGIDVSLYTAAGMFVDMETTSTGINGENGFYIFDNIQPGGYYVVFDIPTGFNPTTPDLCGNDALDSDVTDAIAPGSTNIFSLNAGESDMDLDLGLTQPSCIGDRVWNDSNQNGIQDTGELGLQNIGVELYSADPISGLILVGIKKTDSNGSYEFCDLSAGAYTLKFSDVPFGWVFSPQNAGADDAVDSDVNSLGESSFVSLASGVNFNNLDAGIYDLNIANRPPYQITFWPNPSSGLTTHSIESDRPSSLRWEIIKSTGEIAMSHSEEDIIEGANRFQSDLSNLPAGMYLIRYFLKGKRITKTIIIID